MEYKALKQKTEKELHDLLGEKRTMLRELRHKDSERQLKDVRSLRLAKKDIARILTELEVRLRASAT